MLQRCARCTSVQLVERYFEKNRKGEYKKTCIKCLKIHNCNQCDKKFSQKSSLKKHIQTVHEKLKPYACDQCDLKFGEKCSLNRHIKGVHEKLKPFSCNQCDYKCGQKADLKKHIKICTGEFSGSRGEYVIKLILDELKVDYIYDSTYWGVKDKGLLKWDFIINPESETPAVIEYDGVGHFLPTRWGGISQELAEANLKSAQKRDKIKDDHCDDNCIFMMRIPYWEKNNIETLVRGFLKGV